MPIKEELDPIIDSVKVAEGYRTYLYIDATGHQTFGYGWNVDNGIDQSLAEAVLNTQLKRSRKELDSVIIHKDLPQKLHNGLTELMFWVGLPTFLTFENMIGALKRKDYKEAKKHFMDSKIHREFTTRASRIAKSFDS